VNANYGEAAHGLGQVYRSDMSTLVEIESAIHRLPLAEQEELLRRLEARLRHRPDRAESISREVWMQRLDALRTSIGSGTINMTCDNILTELREE
jgi:hypothetical protein